MRTARTVTTSDPASRSAREIRSSYLQASTTVFLNRSCRTTSRRNTAFLVRGFHHAETNRGCSQLHGYRRRSPAGSEIGDCCVGSRQSLRGDQGLDDEPVEAAVVVPQRGQIDASVPAHQQGDIGREGLQARSIDLYARSAALRAMRPGSCRSSISGMVMESVVDGPSAGRFRVTLGPSCWRRLRGAGLRHWGFECSTWNIACVVLYGKPSRLALARRRFLAGAGPVVSITSPWSLVADGTAPGEMGERKET